MKFAKNKNLLDCLQGDYWLMTKYVVSEQHKNQIQMQEKQKDFEKMKAGVDSEFG